MFTSKNPPASVVTPDPDLTKVLANQAAAAVDHGIRPVEEAAKEKLESLAATVEDATRQARPFLHQAGDQFSERAQRGLDTVRDSAQHLRGKVIRTSDSTAAYVKDEPLKALLIATAAGAALMALAGWLSYTRNR